MIYTLTLNPSIDYVIFPNEPFKMGDLNRFEKSDKYPGGKGINVSRVLKELSVQSVALGFIGGFTGEYIINELNKADINTQFIETGQDSRINVKLKGQTETEIDDLGPHITRDKQEELLLQFENLQENDIVILSGSKPLSLPDDFYQQVIQVIVKRKASFVIDTTGDELLNALSSKPLLIKPNKEELESLYSIELSDDKDMVRCGLDLHSKGAEHVIISMGANGAFLINDQGVFHGYAQEGNLINSVGAGDSMVAGFIAKLQEIGNPIKAFEYSLACGSATAYNKDLASLQDIENLYGKVSVIPLIK